jgi:hypothetical protein
MSAHYGLIQAANKMLKDMMPRDMASLPNASGYEFIGCFKDGSESPCIVKRDSSGMHGVFRVENDAPCWFQLAGWKRKTR